MHLCMYMGVCACAHVCAPKYVHEYVCDDVFVFVFIFVFVLVLVFVCERVDMYVNICIYMYAYAVPNLLS